MNDVIFFCAAFVGGLVLWTFLEYVLHRFAFHERKLGKRAAREHLRHHAKPDYFATWMHKLTLAVPILGALGGGGYLLAGVGGLGLVFGTVCGWQMYEVIHRGTHVRAPFGRYGEWARAHHLHHHFQSPKMNHGVTTPVWDWVFGTLEKPQSIRVPRKHVHAFAWLLDDEGVEVHERYRALYSLVGR